MKIIKRDGREVVFSSKKIRAAIRNTLAELRIKMKRDEFNTIVNKIINSVDANSSELNKMTVEEVQDVVIKVLKTEGYKNVAVAYSNYRKERTRLRDIKSDLMKSITQIGVLTDRDNANVGNNFSSKLLRIASESNKWHNLAIMPKRLAKAHEVGDLYFHDLDSYNLTVNCLHVPTKEILEGSFNTGYGTINPPKSIESACELSCILLQSTQNDMYGGQSHPDFDNDLGSFVDLTRQKVKKELESLNLTESKINEVIEFKVEKHVRQAMQGVVYNLNTMHSRAGSQVPFSSVNLGIPNSEDAALVCRVFLEEYDKGLGKGEQPIFPNIIFRVKDGVNRENDDKYHYLYELACKVAAKRMNPTFMNIDADFNKEYYDMGYMPATMGCVDGQEIITYKIEDLLYVESFKRMWDRLSKLYEIEIQKDGENLYMKVSTVQIYDTLKGFVNVKTIIKNEDNSDWTRLKFSNGRTLLATSNHPLPIIDKGRVLVSDLQIGDEIHTNPKQYSEETFIIEQEEAWLYGFVLCDGCYDSSLVISIALDTENDIELKYKEIAQKYFNFDIETIERHREQKGEYKDIVARGKTKTLRKNLERFYGGLQKEKRHIPSIVFNWTIEGKKGFLAGMIDADGYINNNTHGGSVVQLGSTNKELALQTMALAQSLGFYSKIYLNNYSKNVDKVRYRVEFVPTEDFVKNYIVSEKKRNNFVPRKKENIVHNISKVTEIKFLGNLNNCSYDVETESDHFEVSGIYSHNCRTYLMKNVNGEPGCKGRGNIAPTTVNLPRIGIQAEGDINKFFDIFEKRLILAKESLLHRYDILKNLKVRDLPFVAGQNLMKGSEGLAQEDSIEPILKQGTWGIGFIGLAETLVALTGKHHGECEESKELGLRIIQFLRDFCDKTMEETHLNWSAYATPAEGLSGKFIKQDQKIFGIIKGVTDKDYYTNSFHIPVGYPISIKDKIDIEAPYHKLCNGGHISYIEIDNTPDGQTIMNIINYAYKNTNISYMGVNFHIRYCKECGTYLYSNHSKCPKCGSTNIQGISRVTGYLSLDERFGPGKTAERKDRISHSSTHAHNYDKIE